MLAPRRWWFFYGLMARRIVIEFNFRTISAAWRNVLVFDQY
jgi:hypothetical protein